MSVWGGGGKSAEGILRSKVSTGSKEELLVFGYSCKLFRDDERARDVDQGKLLIPWSGDETLRIDRYDARGALHELAALEAPPGGHDWRLELTDAERRVEQLCDEERYRALYCDEEEELMYKEEELKRMRAAGYGQIGFNYDAETKPEPPPPADPAEVDEPFTPSPQLQALLLPDVILPETQKLNAIIEKTALFISRQGAQMEILLRAKQAGNAQFSFLDMDGALHRYYRLLLDAIRNNKYGAPPDAEQEVKPEEHEDYLHPSLAAPLIESAPLIPSIHYKPSADCDYSMLVSRIRGTREEDEPEPAVPVGELAPPGTQPLTLPAASRHRHEITRAPVLYAAGVEPDPPVHTAYPATPLPAAAQTAPPQQDPIAAATVAPPAPRSAGLNLMHYYGSGSESEHSDGEEAATAAPPTAQPPARQPPLVTPPPDVQVIIDKMAAYVARNGDEFQEIVKAKKDPRFTFLDQHHPYHAYYMRLMLRKRGGSTSREAEPLPCATGAPPAPPVNHGAKEDAKKVIAPVSFSIKKLKDPEMILPKPALPYESSSDEEKEPSETDSKIPETPTQTTSEAVQDPVQPIKCATPPQNITALPKIPQSLIYKVDTTVTDEKPTLLTPLVENIHPQDSRKIEERLTKTEEKIESKDKEGKRKRKVEDKLKDTAEEKIDSKVKESNGKIKEEEKLRNADEKVDSKVKKPKSKIRENGDGKSRSHRSKSSDGNKKEKSYSRSKVRERSASALRRGSRSRDVSRERKSSRSRGGSRERSRSKEKKKDKTEVITVGDKSEDELIDLTGDISEGIGESEPNCDHTKQSERRRRAAAFLAAVGRDVTSVAPPPVVEDNTLACAMVKTLEVLCAKKEAAERRRAKRAEREKRSRHRRERRLKEERDGGREKNADKSHHKSKRRKRRSSNEGEEDCSRDSSSRHKRKKSERKHSSSKSKKRKRSKESSRESSPSGATPEPRGDASGASPGAGSGGASGTCEADAAAIRSKLRMLREESEEELEGRRWRAASAGGEPAARKEYSEGEWQTSEEEASSGSGGTD